jgi:hypothetical protein
VSHNDKEKKENKKAEEGKNMAFKKKKDIWKGIRLTPIS